jgi:hypothetical protein
MLGRNSSAIPKSPNSRKRPFFGYRQQSYEFPDKGEIPALKELGEQGWELVSTTITHVGENAPTVVPTVRILCCLKRPKQ